MHEPSQRQETVSSIASLSHRCTCFCCHCCVISSSNSSGVHDHHVEHPAPSTASWYLGLRRKNPSENCFMALPPNYHSRPLGLAPGKLNQGVCPSADKAPKEQQPHSYGVSQRKVWGFSCPRATVTPERLITTMSAFPQILLLILSCRYFFQTCFSFTFVIVLKNTKLIGQRR